MATIKFTSTASDPGFDMVSLQEGWDDFLFDYLDVTGTATFIRFFNDPGDKTTFTGTGFAYDFDNGEINGARAGTIRSIETVINGNKAVSVTGLSVSANTFSDLLSGGRAIEAFDLLIDGNDEITGGTATDVLYGSTGNDTIYGGRGNDSLIGATEDDKLYGGSGADNLRGGSNADFLFGGLGADELRGGGDKDAFVFNTALGGSQRDSITDFVAADDRIRLDDAIFARMGGLGTLDADRFVRGGAAREAADRIIYERSEGVLMYDRDGTGAAEAVIFATVVPGTFMSHLDFVVF